MKNGVLWVVTPCGSCRNRRFGNNCNNSPRFACQLLIFLQYFKKLIFSRMASSAMLRHEVLVRTDVSEEISASIIRVTRINELGNNFFAAYVGC
jgi:hypothetical protein